MTERKPIQARVSPQPRAAKLKTAKPAAHAAALELDPVLPAANGIESRKCERSMLMLDPLLLDKDGRVVARVADISIDGAALYSKGTPFPAGSELSGWLDAPALGAFDEEFVAVWMTVAWSRPEGSSGWFKAGCVFEHADAKERDRLATLINALKSTKTA